MDLLEKITRTVKGNVTEPKTKEKKIKETKKNFKHGNNIIMRTGNFKGYYGFVYEKYPAKYVVLVNNKAATLTKNNFEKTDKIEIGSKVKINVGEFKNKIAQVKDIIKPNIKVYIDAARGFYKSHVIVENGVGKEKQITPDDVFFMDIRLKNGKFFQVFRLSGDKRYYGQEQGQREFKEIGMDDIASFQPGFKEFDGVDEEDIDVKELSKDEVIDYVFTPEKDIHDENINDIVDETEDMSEMDVPRLEDSIFEELPDEKVGIKDIERTAREQRKLSKQEQDIERIVKSILEIFVAINDVNIYDIIASVVSVKEKIINIMKQVTGVDSWQKSDEKYLISYFVIAKLIQVQNPNVQSKDNYIKQLMLKNIFTKYDFMIESVFLNEEIFFDNYGKKIYTVDKKDIVKLYDKDEYFEIYKIMFNNCEQIMEKLFNQDPLVIITGYKNTTRLGRTNKKSEKSRYVKPIVDVIALGSKRKIEEPRTVIYSKDVLSGNIPLSAKRIIWNKSYDIIFKKYKDALITKMQKTKSETQKDVGKYIIDNLERAPLALRELEKELENKNLKRDKQKYVALKRAFDFIFKDLTEQSNMLKEQKLKKMSDITESKKQMSLKRKTARTQKLATEGIGELNIEDDEEIIEDEKLSKKRRNL